MARDLFEAFNESIDRTPQRSAIGSFISDITQRAKAVGLARQQAGIEVEKERALLPIELEKERGKVQAETEGLRSLFGGSQGGAGSSGMGGQPDPGGFQLTQINRGGMTFESPLKGQMEAESASLKKELEMSEKMSQAVRRLSLINRQFKEAAPSGERPPILQRGLGQLEVFGAKTGLAPNPELLALQTNIRPMAINLIRLFGEVGNLSETEQKGAIDTIQQAGLTDSERIQKLRQFAEFALSGASPKAKEFMLRQPDVQKIVSDLGINLGQGSQSGMNESKIRVRNKVTGQKGMISPQFFNQDKYERI